MTSPKTCTQCGGQHFYGNTACVECGLDLTDHVNCRTCEDRGYVTTRMPVATTGSASHVTYTDPCPMCNQDYSRTMQERLDAYCSAK